MQVGSGLSAETKIELFEATRMEPNVTICYQKRMSVFKNKNAFYRRKTCIFVHNDFTKTDGEKKKVESRDEVTGSLRKRPRS